MNLNEYHKLIDLKRRLDLRGENLMKGLGFKEQSNYEGAVCLEDDEYFEDEPPKKGNVFVSYGPGRVEVPLLALLSDNYVRECSAYLDEVKRKERELVDAMAKRSAEQKKLVDLELLRTLREQYPDA